MGGDNNFASCLELLEDQGFKAEHQLFVKLLSCINEYWDNDTAAAAGSDQNSCDPPSNARTAIEEGELELENEGISSEPDLLKTLGKKGNTETVGKENLDNVKLENLPFVPELQEISQELSVNLKETNATEIPLDDSHKMSVSTFACKYCSFILTGRGKGRTFKSRLRQHNKSEHHVCEVCHKKHPNKEELDRHMETEHKDIEGKLVCGIKSCTTSLQSYKADSIGALVAHVKLVHDRVPYICRQCKKPYHDRKRHKLLHRADPSTLFTCKECEFHCITEKNLKRHKSMAHSIANPDKILLCNSCNFKTDGLSHDEEFKLMVHKRVHRNGEISCDMCPYKSPKRYTLKKHLAEKHGLGRVFHCNLCNYKTSGHDGKGHMTIHMARHSKEKPFLCDKCEFSGRTKQSLNRHMQRHDRTTPKYLCDECDYKSFDQSNFAAHRRVKHGLLVLSCAQCDYNTKSTRSLRDHKNKHTT